MKAKRYLSKMKMKCKISHVNLTFQKTSLSKQQEIIKTIFSKIPVKKLLSRKTQWQVKFQIEKKN